MRMSKQDIEWTSKTQKKYVANYLYATKCVLVVARKNYRCCGVNCTKIIKKGTKHIFQKPEHQADYFMRVCSIKCALHHETVYEAKKLSINKVNGTMTFARNISEKTVLKFIHSNQQAISRAENRGKKLSLREIKTDMERWN